MKKFKIFAVCIISFLMLYGCANNKDNVINTNTNTTNTDNVETQQKSISAIMNLNDKEYMLSIDIPEDLQKYITFETEEVSQTSMALVRFEKEDKSANIGTFTLYNQKDYEDIKTQGLPVGDVVVENKDEGFVLTYTGMQDSVFEKDTEEYNIVMEYANSLEDILASVKID